MLVVADREGPHGVRAARSTFAERNRRIGKLSVADQDRIVGAMRTIESVLGEAPANRIVGRSTASQIASASAASCLLRLMYAFTYCAGINRTSWPSAPSSRAQ
jgi:hypothetical protein